jgi:hypothetical protein
VTSALHPKPFEQSALVPADEVVFWTENGPRFGDDPWDCREVRGRASVNDRYLDLRTLPSGWQEPTREVLFCLANPTHPVVIERGIVRKSRGAKAVTLFRLVGTLRLVLHWAADRGVSSPSLWTAAHSDDLLVILASEEGLTGRPLTPTTQSSYMRALRHFWDLRVALTEHLPADPWDGRSTNDLAGFVRPIENVTTPLSWAQWAPLVRASWFVVDKLGPDLIAAVHARRAIQAAAPHGRGVVGAVSDHLDRGGLVPLHTAYGRSSVLERGDPNLGLLCKQLGFTRSPSKKRNLFKTQIEPKLERALADPSRVIFGGVYHPDYPDDPANPWEFGLSEIEHLESVFRGACYVLIAALTGMRDSEIQELERGCRTQAVNGVPGLRASQFKGNDAVHGVARMWFAPKPILRVVELLEQLTVHDALLFARSTTGGEFFPDRDVPRLVAYINSPPSSRPGRGPSFDLEPLDPLADMSQRALRRSFCVFAARYPGAELGLGIQLGQLALRVTSGYTTTSQKNAADLIDHDRALYVNEMVRRVVSGHTTATGPGTERLMAFRASIVTSDAYSDRQIARLAETYHLGSLNDCAYDPALAACGTDGPQLAEHICIKGCSNAVETERHAPALSSQVDRITHTLDAGGLHPLFEERLRSERVQIVQLVRRLEAPK